MFVYSEFVPGICVESGDSYGMIIFVGWLDQPEKLYLKFSLFLHVL